MAELGQGSLREEVFTIRVVKHWHRLFGEVVDAPPLRTSKVRFDAAWSELIWLEMSLLMAGVGPDDL